MVGARQEHRVQVGDAEVAALDPRELPTYTVLVPVYKEANVVADLIANLGALDYPREKLEILLLLEENDTETIEAARAARPPSTITFLIVPPGHPQTKPKACNVGLFFARGEFLVIYDAEDKPEPDQLKKAVIAFRRGGDRLVCVQAALNYWNAADNWLTRMFTVEYSFWFDYMLPGLDRLRLPIPLGGTSNHFRTRGLRMLGGWDPFNVTEDACSCRCSRCPRWRTRRASRWRGSCCCRCWPSPCTGSSGSRSTATRRRGSSPACWATEKISGALEYFSTGM